MNKYRMSMMIILIVLVFLYIIGVLGITNTTNFALTASALIFSISSVIDTFADENRIEKSVRMVLDTFALGVAIVFPNLTDMEFVNMVMKYFDTNILLLLALFFTMAGQWATEIKIKDIKRSNNK